MVAVTEWLRRDFQRLWQVTKLGPPPPVAPGLYTYMYSPPGGQRRVHLRVEESQAGVLFVDVTDVIHLNSTATKFAKWALDKVPLWQAEMLIRSRTLTRQWSQQRADLKAMYDMVERLADPRQGCPTCALGGVDQLPLFSTPISAPYKADLAITYACNNDCPHCYNEADRLTLQSMPVDDWKRVIDRLHQVGIPHLIFTGGEATMYGDLPELIAYANRKGPICGLNTNARRMSYRNYADELFAAGLNHVQVTLGSHRAEVHNRMMNARSFDQTVRGIENAQAAGIHTITNTTLMQMNAGEIEQTIDFLYALGIRTFAINGMIYSGGGYDTGQAITEEKMQPVLIRIREKAEELDMRFLWYTPTQYCRLSPVELEIGAKRCNAGEYSLCVEPNADVLPCQSFYVAAGNVLRDPWDKIWNSPLFQSFRDRELDPQGSGLPEKCWECPDLPLCGGGCRIEREAEAGLRSATANGGCSGGGCSGGGCSGGGCGSQSKQGSSEVGFVALDSLLTDEMTRGIALRGSGKRGTGDFGTSLPERG
jgi:radical SAM protein with 4Fe4S-binding SPASM domain